MIIKIKQCCYISSLFEIALARQLDNSGKEKLYESRLITKFNGYNIFYCPICGKKVEIEVRY